MTKEAARCTNTQVLTIPLFFIVQGAVVPPPPQGINPLIFKTLGCDVRPEAALLFGIASGRDSFDAKRGSASNVLRNSPGSPGPRDLQARTKVQRKDEARALVLSPWVPCERDV